jgi:glutamate--cysteine ligase
MDQADHKYQPITGEEDLVAFIASGEKSADQFRIGTEHEKFVFDATTLKPLDYFAPNGTRAILKGMERFGWEAYYEGPNVIALTKPDGSSITLEPGGQLELSGAPLETIHQTCREVTTHLKEVKEVAGELGVGFLGMGYTPTWNIDEIPWMPKGRYKIMREYMPKRGTLGHHMMKATCTVQVNLDFSSEAHMVKMFRTSLALQPIATALWANSPLKGGKKNGFLSYRSHIWTDTDPDRCGMLPFVFEDGFGYQRYVDYLLNVPMYFVYRDGKYIDASGQSFRDFMAGRLPAAPGEHPTLKDWEDHMTVAFPEVRLKRFLEMRGADGGPWNSLCALPAFWTGLMYDDQALDAAHKIIEGWTIADIEKLRADVPAQALKAKVRGRTVQEIAIQLLEYAREGLHRRAKLDSDGDDESGFLNSLFAIARSGKTPAEATLELFDGEWKGDASRAFKELSY